ncbi:hypothetical protein E2562_003132 [Oryza meyeriana var. granulata]|uniref:Uncharacterized protein n=1 Tax=Oryza meyeriana var. granulata TaxID=110450 RepID=A0A6G1EA78_9ORYZ|nr:hypothetical protein E2562_003132 [Oryza meyeriana var. granulata]
MPPSIHRSEARANAELCFEPAGNQHPHVAPPYHQVNTFAMPSSPNPVPYKNGGRACLAMHISSPSPHTPVSTPLHPAVPCHPIPPPLVAPPRRTATGVVERGEVRAWCRPTPPTATTW